MDKKRHEQAQAFAPKPPTSSAYQRQVRLQQLSMPIQRPPRMPTLTLTLTQVRLQQLSMPIQRPPRMLTRPAHGARPAWFAGTPRRRDESPVARAVH